MSALLKQEQFNLFTMQDEAQLYLDSDRPGFFAILQNVKNRMRQRSYRLDILPQVIDLLDKLIDSWISQAEFTLPNRRVVNLWRIGLLFVDIDTYNIQQLARKSPDDLVQILIGFCDAFDIPRPSFVVFSGRGLQAKWLLDKPLPRSALLRWGRAQSELVERLSKLGADQNAKDASRVLRLVQTTNTKNNEICRVVYVNEENGLPKLYGFDELCEYLLPFSREQLAQMRSERSAAAKERQAAYDRRKALSKINGGANGRQLKGFSGRQLAWDRLNDLRKLSELRGGYAQGQRMLHLFWQLNFLLLSGVTNSQQMYYEAKALAHKIDKNWHSDQSALGTLYSKAKQYEAGEQIEFNGKRYPALYTPKNDTLINQFEITDDEQRQLRTIITPSLARERDADRKTVARRAAGAIDRKTYLDHAQQRKQQAQKLRLKGMSYRAIAHELSVSVASVHNYLK